MEKLHNKNIRRFSLAALVCVGALALAGCDNTEGAGNKFVIRGTVTEVGEQSVKLNNISVKSAEGEAVGWFDDGKQHQVHDNYRDCGWSNSEHDVGNEFAVDGTSEDLGAVAVGENIELTGKIRDSYSRCGKYSEYELRPVYDSLQEIKA